MKYSELKTSDIVSRLDDPRLGKKEVEYLKGITGLVSSEEHPIINVGYYLRTIFLELSGKYTINIFETVYDPLFSSFDPGNTKNTRNHHNLDILGIFSRFGNKLQGTKEENKKAIETSLNKVNGILSKVRSNLSKNAFDSYLSVNGDTTIELIKQGGFTGFNDVDTFLKYLSLFSGIKKYNLNGYPYSLLRLMFNTDYNKFLEKFLTLNGKSGVLSDISAELSKISSVDINAKDSYFFLFNELKEDRSKYMKYYTYGNLANWNDGSEKALDNFYGSIQVLFYIKGYLDYVYKKEFDSEHKRTVIGFSKGFDNSKVEKAKAKNKATKPTIKNTKKTKAIGVVGGDFGNSILSKSSSFSQEVVNMQVTLLYLILNEKIFSKKKLYEIADTYNDSKFVEVLDYLDLNDKTLLNTEIGGKISIPSILTDGIFGKRTTLLIKLFQDLALATATKLGQQDIVNTIQSNGVFDKQTITVVNKILNTHPNVKRPDSGVETISKADIKKQSASKEYSLFKEKAPSSEIEKIKAKILKNDTMLAKFKTIPKDMQEKVLSDFAMTTKGLDDADQDLVLANILGGGNNTTTTV